MQKVKNGAIINLPNKFHKVNVRIYPNKPTSTRPNDSDEDDDENGEISIGSIALEPKTIITIVGVVVLIIVLGIALIPKKK